MKRIVGFLACVMLLACAAPSLAQSADGLQVMSLCAGKYSGHVDKALMAQIKAERNYELMFGTDVARYLLFKGDLAPDLIKTQTFRYSTTASPVHFLQIEYPFKGKWDAEDCSHTLFIGPDAKAGFSFQPVPEVTDWRLALSQAAQAHFEALVALCATYKGRDFGTREYCLVAKEWPDPKPGEMSRHDECVDETIPNEPVPCIRGDFSPEIAAKRSVLRLRITSGDKRWLVTVVGDLVEVVPET